MTDERAKLRRQLQRHAAKRRQSLDAAEAALKEIADLLPFALEAGITKIEIQRLTGVSRPTIDRLLRERR
jgi:Fic family protein